MNEGIEKNPLSQPEIHAALDEIFSIAADIRGATAEIEGASFRLGREPEPCGDDSESEKLSDTVTGRLESLRQLLRDTCRDTSATANAISRLV